MLKITAKLLGACGHRPGLHFSLALALAPGRRQWVVEHRVRNLVPDSQCLQLSPQEVYLPVLRRQGFLKLPSLLCAQHSAYGDFLWVRQFGMDLDFGG